MIFKNTSLSKNISPNSIFDKSFLGTYGKRGSKPPKTYITASVIHAACLNLISHLYLDQVLLSVSYTSKSNFF